MVCQVASPRKYLAFVPPEGTSPVVPDVITAYVVLLGTSHSPSFLKYLVVLVPNAGINPADAVVAVE